MKTVLKMLVADVLALIAGMVVRRYKPHVVMVTGSVGKTSTKDAVAAVLTSRFLVRKSEKSFNSDFGVPFTILGVKNPWGNPLAWLSVVKRAVSLLTLPTHYPNMLVLEVGADQPSDLVRKLRIATPDAVVVTRLPEVPVHVEAYPSPEAVREEEFSPAYALALGAPLVVSADDHYAMDAAVRTSARIISFGTTAGAAVQVSNCDFYQEHKKVVGMRATITIGGKSHELVVKGSVGATQLLPSAAALALAGAFSISPAEALTALTENYEPPPGRGRLFSGFKNSILIDDSYNASPAAVEEALANLKIFPYVKRRIAVLGDMLELGRYSVMEHERIGKLAADSADLVVAVGVRARAFAAAAGERGLAFSDSRTAARELIALVEEGDVILIKGSQSIRTERIVEVLLADPRDSHRLVRQEKEWKRRR